MLLGFADVIGDADYRRYVVMFFLWAAWQGFPQLVEQKHLQWRWFPLDKLPPQENMTPGTVILATEILPERFPEMCLGFNKDLPVDEEEVLPPPRRGA